MNNAILAHIEKIYHKEFNQAPEILLRSPGRINLIGEHTDYNLGYVLPAAVDKSIYMAIGPSGDEENCRLISVDQNESFEFNLSEFNARAEQKWYNYILGVAGEMLQSGNELRGFNLVFSGDVPQGAGMSSSAALECGTAIGLNQLFSLALDKQTLIQLSQKAEHHYVGVMCGIMDQFASVMGKKDHVLLLDCRSLDYEYFPLAFKEYGLLLCNSNVSHNLASSAYNVRRSQCEETVAILQQHYVEIESLRDVNIEMLQKHVTEIPAINFQRSKYVIEENGRVMSFCEALKNENLIRAGEILAKAQHAMETGYEITCPEIDFMAQFANSKNEVLGSRMMGGGFGGCTINLIKNDYKQRFIDELSESYYQKYGIKMDCYDVNISDGGEVL